ncbi:MAG: hypothetical protein M3083_07110 [Actinomycetota bacterium]|nr:hypothetical protein [Actinomycetota bacterium]
MHRKGLVAALGVVLVLLAACGKSSSTKTAAGFGSPGNASKADKTVEVHILSSLMYNPSAVSVKPGETVVFKVSNDTTGIHEFVLGDTKVQDDYEKMMTSMGTVPMSMADHTNSLNIPPGQTKQLAWTFPSTSGTTVIFGSHEPGDYAHGLRGLVTVA